jgi:serine/threonine-protein kinase
MSQAPFSPRIVPPPDETLPRPFGPYALLTRIARGGMGDVFLAKHGGLQGFEKMCVVKTLRPDLGDETEYLTRFTEEARVVVQLSHRGVCTVFDVGRVNGQLYLAMDHVVGRDLRTLLAHGALPVPLAIHVVSEVLEALDYAHRFVDAASGEHLGVVHRDVSPHNVLVSVEGDVKLIDFGIASTSRVGPVLEPGIVLGKVTYMSPEHARGESIDGRGDQYAAAVMLVELLTGAPFYDGLPREQLRRTTGKGGYRPPGFRALDEKLRAILDKALSPSPADRFARASDFGEAIVRWARERGQAADARDLRRYVTKIFPTIDEEARKTARGFVDVHPPNLDVVTKTPGFETIATTMMIAPTTSGMGQEPASTMIVREGAPARPSLASRLALVAAGALAAFALTAVAIAATRLSEPADVVAVEAAPSDAGVAVAVRLVVDAGPPSEDAPAADKPDEPPPAVDDDASPQKENPTPRPRPRLDADTRRDLQQLQASRECMKKLACASGVRDWLKNRDLGNAALRAQFSDLVKGCAKECRLLR